MRKECPAPDVQESPPPPEQQTGELPPEKAAQSAKVRDDAGEEVKWRARSLLPARLGRSWPYMTDVPPNHRQILAFAHVVGHSVHCQNVYSAALPAMSLSNPKPTERTSAILVERLIRLRPHLDYRSEAVTFRFNDVDSLEV